MLELSGVSKSYQGNCALQSIDLRIPESSTSVLIGPSGCGKSTLLRLLAGLVTADQGSVSFHGRSLSKDNIQSWRQQLGYVIQEGGLFPHMSAWRNVSLMANYLGWERDKIHQRVVQLAQLVHLPEKLLARLPQELSGGQRQRVSLMRALMLDPPLLLLDEPLGALDPMIRYQLQQELRSIFDSLKKTVIMVIHDLAEAAYFADQIVLIREGRIVQQGSLQSLSRSPADTFVSAFIRAQQAPSQALNQLLE